MGVVLGFVGYVRAGEKRFDCCFGDTKGCCFMTGMPPKLRRVPTASGATAVQIVVKESGRVRVLEHLGLLTAR